MLDWNLGPTTSVTHHCALRGPLPEALVETVRELVDDDRLAADILVAAGSILDQLADLPGAPPGVDVVVRGGLDTLELAMSHGSLRETLICTLG